MSTAVRDAQGLRALIEARLRDTEPAADAHAALAASELAAELSGHLPLHPVAAAVLVPIVDHRDELTVLLTQRATHLKHHPGQISFPGGRIETQDAGPWEAALREAHEEIGLSPERVRRVGYLRSQLVLSGYWVTPVVGLVQPGFNLQLDPTEVEAAFEVPLEYILDTRHHEPRERRIGEVTVRTFDIVFRGHVIWGATAAMLLDLCRQLTHPAPIGSSAERESR